MKEVLDILSVFAVLYIAFCWGVTAGVYLMTWDDKRRHEKLLRILRRREIERGDRSWS